MDALLEAAKGLPETPMDCENSSSTTERAQNDEPMQETSASSPTERPADEYILECEEELSNQSSEIDTRSFVLEEETGEEIIVSETLMEVDDGSASKSCALSSDLGENLSNSAACSVSSDPGEHTSNAVTEKDATDSHTGMDDITIETEKDESSSVADSDLRKAEAFSKLQSVLASAKKKMTSTDQVADSSIVLSSTHTSAKKGSPPNGSIIIDLEKENSGEGSIPQSKELNKTGSQTTKLKSLSTLTKKVLLPNPTSTAGKLINIQIMNKEKLPKNITISPTMKQINMQSTMKKMPLILPKPVTKPTFGISQTLNKITVPRNYVLVQTDKGLMFMHSDGVPKGAVKATSTQSNRVLNFTNNVSHSNTPSSISVGIKNASTTVNQTLPLSTSLNKTATLPDSQNTPLSSSKMYPVVFNSLTSGTSFDLSGMKMRVTTTKVYQSKPPEESIKKGVIIDGCQHPVCTQYRNKVMEDLRTKLHNRDRKLKSTRMGRERSVKRAAREMQTIKGLERQRELYLALDSFPDSLCKTLIRSQLRPNEGKRVKQLYQEEVNGFVRRLHSMSPEAYDIVRNVFNKVLPEAKSINSWSFGENEVSVTETAPPGKAANSGEEADSDSDLEGDEEMGEEEPSII